MNVNPPCDVTSIQHGYHNKRVCMVPWLFYERIFTYHVNPPYDVTSIQHGYHNKRVCMAP